MAIAPSIQDSDLVSFTILSNGASIPGTYEVIRIKTRHHLNTISKAKIILADGNVTTQEFNIATSKTFKPGTDITIKLGYHDKDETVFKGIVIKQTIKIDSDSEPQLHITCRDKALKMTVAKKNAIYLETTDSDVLKKVINNAGFASDVTKTYVGRKKIVQDDISDWDFLLQLAAQNGLVVRTDSGTIVIAKPAVWESPILEVEYGRDIYDCNIKLDATFQYAEVKARSRDIDTGELIEATSNEPIVNREGNMTGKELSKVLGADSYVLKVPDGASLEELKVRANALILISRLSRYQGDITFQGSSKARPNSILDLKGLSDRFNGCAFISGVTHTAAKGQWLTKVRLGLDTNAEVVF